MTTAIYALLQIVLILVLLGVLVVLFFLIREVFSASKWGVFFSSTTPQERQVTPLKWRELENKVNQVKNEAKDNELVARYTVARNQLRAYLKHSSDEKLQDALMESIESFFVREMQVSVEIALRMLNNYASIERVLAASPTELARSLDLKPEQAQYIQEKIEGFRSSKPLLIILDKG